MLGRLFRREQFILPDMFRKLFRRLFIALLVLGFFGALVAGVGATWLYYYLTRDLPKMSRIEDYRPPLVTSVYAADGTLVAEFYKERRYPLKIADVPERIRNCFIAAEDSSFYSHKGIDPVSILRAAWKNFESGHTKQGASTITQQVVKNLLLSPERSFERKAKEAILSYQLETHFSKEEILEVYLNQNFFGNTAYGLRAAARLYFKKEPAELSIAEGAMLAGLLQAPSAYSPLSNMPAAKSRQRYVIGQMLKAGFITKDEADQALNEEIKVYRANAKNIFAAPYYVGEVRRILTESPRWRDIDIDTAGLEIHTALDLAADRYGSAALRSGLRLVDKRRGWRGVLGHIEGANEKEFLERFGNDLPTQLETETVYPALVTALAPDRSGITVKLRGFKGVLKSGDMSWAQRRLDSSDRVYGVDPTREIKVGDVIEVALQKSAANKDPQFRSHFPEPIVEGESIKVSLDQTPELEGGIVLIDPHSGYVLATVGGYSYQRSQFNRATQALRQPGSTFKPVIYLAAVDGFGYTPSTIVYDRPRAFRVGDQVWEPANYDKKFMNEITLRTALELSRNLVSADIISRIGIDPVIKYAKLLGINSPMGRNPSLSLGSSEVTMLELTRAYGVFATKGVLFDSVFVTRMLDRDGNVLFDAATEQLQRAKEVINENSAFIMASMMKGVVERGTATKIKELKRPSAGKTGTSNNQMDTWYVGYTPNWAAGVWVGFDVKRPIGNKETGGRVAAPIWLDFMYDYLNEVDRRDYQRLVEESKEEAIRLGIEFVPPEPLAPLDFSVPEGVEGFWVDRTTGLLSEPDAPGAIYEYFVRGTEPSRSAGTEDTKAYLDSPEL